MRHDRAGAIIGGGQRSRACLTSTAVGRFRLVGMSRTQVLTDEMWARIEPLLPDRLPASTAGSSSMKA